MDEEGSAQLVYCKMKNFLEEFNLIIGSIVIGVPLGLITGLICWIKFPFVLYTNARAKLAMRRIQEARSFLDKHGQGQKSEDIWEEHIERMKAKKNNYDN